MTTSAASEQPYAHEFHAGNVGDVLKHVVLTAVLENAPPDTLYVDTHSGEGSYRLRVTGEWTEGVYRIWREPFEGPGVSAWLDAVRALDPRADRPMGYPGSPALAARLLGPEARLVCFEAAAGAAGKLARELADDRRIEVREGDGWAGLLETISGERSTVALVDPPYVEREDWNRASQKLIEAHRAAPYATLLLWYPIKSRGRPQAVVRAIRDAGVPATTMELITMPLELKRNRLNGSGLLCVNVGDELVDAVTPVLQKIGRRCAIRGGYWSLNVNSWRAPPLNTPD